MRFDWTEGATPLDPEVAEALIPNLSLQSELNEFEAANILRAQRWAVKSSTVRNGILEGNTLEALHRRMFDKTWRWAGKFRQTAKSVGVESYRISSELRTLREDVRAWIEFGSYLPDEIAARFHHRLVWIHPFVNGNGRHARLAADLLCIERKWEPFSWGSIDLGSISATRRRYIEALRAADRHDLRPLLAFVRT